MTFEEVKMQFEKIAAEHNSARLPIPDLKFKLGVLKEMVTHTTKMIVEQHQKALGGEFDDSLRLMSMIKEQTEMSHLIGQMEGFIDGVNYVVEKTPNFSNHVF